MRDLLMLSCAFVLLGACGPAFAGDPLAMPAAPGTEMTTQTEQSDGLLATTRTTTLGDGLSGTLRSTTITNKPIPDSPESRKENGGPDSAAGRATRPMPGPVEDTGKSTAKARTPPAPQL